MSNLLVRSAWLLLAGAILGACGGGTGSTSSSSGGGGSGGGGGGGGPFSVTGGPNGGMLGGLNLPVGLQFSKDVDPATVNSESIQIKTVLDPAGQATASPGIVAGVVFSISGKTLTITPTVAYEPEQVTYGFVANALFEIAFGNPSTGPSVKSLGGEALTNFGTTFFFRTPSKGFDFNPGYPAVRAFLVDDPTTVVLPSTISDANGDNDLVSETLAYFSGPVEIVGMTQPLQVPSAPVRDILFIFADALLPSTVVNLVDQSSPAIRISINSAPLPTLLPKTIPAEYSFTHQQSNLSIVRWHADSVAYPPGSFLFVDVDPTVQDLACNSKASLTGSGVPDLSAVLRVAEGVDTGIYHVTEPFDDSAQEDEASTSAAWASTFPGLLGPVLGGGTGEDGPLIVDATATASNPGDTEVPVGALINFSTKHVLLPTVAAVAEGIFETRVYNLSTLTLPPGWTIAVLFDRNGDGTPDPDEYLVQSPGHPLDGLGAPLILRCSGNLQLFGTVDVSGRDAATLVRPESALDPLFNAYKGQGSPGSAALQAAGSGGRGGDVLLQSSGGSTPIPLTSPPAAPAYQPSDTKLVGATGRSTVLTPTTLFDPNANFFLLDTVNGSGDPDFVALVNSGELLLQPNLGVGSSLLGNSGTANQSIDENHPTFVVESVSVVGGMTTFTVSSDPGDPTLTQASKNTGMAAIASAGDCYLIGRLAGGKGLDATALARGGVGALPYLVVNEGALGITTTGGGGGGGGSIGAGSAGASDGPASNPTVNQRGASGGIALDDSPGAAGGIGTVEGIGRVIDDTHIDVISQLAGRPLSELTGSALIGSGILPNVPADGWIFIIEAFDGITFTVARIQLDLIDIGLTDGPGLDGPALTPGTDYAFRIIPSLDIGGGGGGGTGVSVTGTVNNAATVLPLLAPGAGGGSGGGSVVLETARDMILGPTALIDAGGGTGGIVFDVQTAFAGGGGGGGGNAVIRAGRSLQAFLGARISAAGGKGGSLPGLGLGGTGGAGYIRVESFDDSLMPGDLIGATDPVLDATNYGRLLGLPQGVGQSLYYVSSVLNPAWQHVDVSYLADTDDDAALEPFSWSFGDTGILGGPEGYLDPPFRIGFNSVGFNDTGFLDDTQESSSFYASSDLVSARTGLAYDAAGGVLLYSVGEECAQIHRLDPATLLPVASGPTALLLPAIPSVGSSILDIVSLAVDTVNAEVFLLERVTRRVHVIDLNTAAFKRTITLPLDLQGAMTYLPAPQDRLLFADNATDRLVTFAPRDASAAAPATTDYMPLIPTSQFPVQHDGVPLDIELVGLAHDSATQSVWCTDAMAGRLFQVSLAPGSEGSSTTGIERFAPLVFAGQGVVPSGVAFRSGELFLVHATDPQDSRIQSLSPAAVSLSGGDLVLTTFGVLVPEAPLAISDGDIFLRFRVTLDGVHDAEGVSFRSVRLDAVDLSYSNSSF